MVRNLEVIGEAVKHLPQSMREAQPDVAWSQIAGMRDVLAHGYFGVDEELVWDVVANHVGVLADVTRVMLDAYQ